jgi:hypothetical protein
MATTPDVNIGSSDVQAGMSNSMTASIMLQTYTNTVLQTPDIKLPSQVDTDSNSTVVEDLPAHQALARTNATYYINTINPLIVNTVADVIGFGNLWSAEYNQLYSLAENINEGNNAETFTQGMNNLINKTEKAEASTQPVIDALNAFLPLIQTDERNFTQDATNVNNALGGEEGEIAQLQKEIDAYNDAMSKDLAIIGAGATADVVGGLMIVVGVLGEIETAGVSTALIVGGVAVIAGGTTAMGVAGADYTKTKNAYAQATAQLAQDQQIMTATQQAATNISILEDAVSQGITAVENLQKGWNSLQADFNQVVEALEQADDPDMGTWLTSLLSAANADWEATLQLAKSIQQYGTLPVQKSDA